MLVSSLNGKLKAGDWVGLGSLGLAIAVFLLPVSTGGQEPVPVPVTVALDSGGCQIQPAATADWKNNLLVIWHDSSSNGDRILAQGFDRRGGRIFTVSALNYIEFRKATTPALAINFAGTAVAAWSEGGAGAWRIHFRRLEVTGVPSSSLIMPPLGEWIISGGFPSVAEDSVGNIILVWQSNRNGNYDIFGTWIAALDIVGTANKDSTVFAWIDEVRINQALEGDQVFPAVAADRQGNFVVAWKDSQPDSLGIRVRAFSHQGIALGEALLPPGRSVPARDVSPPSVSIAGFSRDSSHFLVSWVEEDTLGLRTLYLEKVSLFLWSVPYTFSQDPNPGIIDSSSSLTLLRPSVSGREGGNVTVTWTKIIGGVAEAFVLNFLIDEGYSGRIIQQVSRPVSGFGSPAANPVAAARPDSSFITVWEDWSGPDADLRMQSFDLSGIVEEPVYISPVEDPQAISRYAALVGSPDSGFTIFWEKVLESSSETTDSIAVIEKISFDYDGRVNEPAQQLQPSGWFQRKPVAAQNHQGKYLVAWQEKGSAAYRVCAMLFSPGGVLLGNVLTVEESGRNYLGDVAAAISEQGEGYLVWERWSPLAVFPDLVCQRLDSLGRADGFPQVVYPSAAGGGTFASVAAGKDGRYMVVWRHGGFNGINARIQGSLFGPRGEIIRQEIQISAEGYHYLGSLGRPVVAISPLTDNFIVLWQEFFSERQRLYYRFYNSSGDSLALSGGQYRQQFDTLEKGSSLQISQTNPTLAVDERGDHLALWVEKITGGLANLVGLKMDSLGAALGSIFKVPGVKVSTLPVVSILGIDRIALAWQDTVEGQVRIMAQVIELNLHTVLGSVALASGRTWGEPLFVHLSGNVNDSVEVGNGGAFCFRNLTEGDYVMRLSSAGQNLPLERALFTLKSTDADTVELGVVADLSSAGGPVSSLPRGFRLEQNMPNPFNPSTTVRFELGGLEKPVKVTLTVYDLRGALIKILQEGELGKGVYSVIWDGKDDRGRNMTSGVYFYRLRVGENCQVRKMVLLK